VLVQDGYDVVLTIVRPMFARYCPFK